MSYRFSWRKRKACPHEYEDDLGSGFFIEDGVFTILTTESTKENVEGLKEFYCPLCGKRFKTPKELTQ